VVGESVNQENVSNNQSSEVEIQRIAFEKALLNLHGPWLNACQNELEAFRSDIVRVNKKISLDLEKIVKKTKSNAITRSLISRKLHRQRIQDEGIVERSEYLKIIPQQKSVFTEIQFMYHFFRN
jgi:hypothetical protein